MCQLQLKKENFSFTSSNGVDIINGFIVRKQFPPYKAIVQISHGMQEYADRYENFINFLANKGYVVVINDHLGHKNSVSSKNNLGFMADKDGYKHVLNDLATISGRVRKNFPELKLFLLGHSMGSFYARVFAAKFPYLLDGIIISGTGGKNKMLSIGKTVINIAIKLKGTKYRSKFITKLIFGNFQSKIKNPKTGSDWLSRDEDVVEKYINDEYCNFIFTLSGYRDLITINSIANSNRCFEKTKKDIPYFMFAGDMDPVGEWGNGVKEVYEKYKQFGVKDIKLILYPEGRHEMLNEINREQVYSDVANWLESKIQ